MSVEYPADREIAAMLAEAGGPGNCATFLAGRGPILYALSTFLCGLRTTIFSMS